MWNARSSKSQAFTVGDECESFLAGGYADYLRSDDRAVPAWAWLNAVAHCTKAELQEMAAHTDGSGSDDLWEGAMRFLAGELVARATDDVPIAAMQRAVLVPLELRLAATWFAPTSAGEVVSQVLEDLDNYHRRRARNHNLTAG